MAITVGSTGAAMATGSAAIGVLLLSSGLRKASCTLPALMPLTSTSAWAGVISRVTARTTTGWVLSVLAVWSTASTRRSWRMVLDSALPSLPTCRVASTSTRLPGSRKPPTPTTSSTRTEMARLLGSISEARVLPPICSANRAPRRMSPRSREKVAILPTTFSGVSKASSGAASLGMRTTVTCWGSIICPKAISTVAITTFCWLSSGLVFSRAVSQLLAIHVAPSPRITDRTIKVSVREFMTVTP